MQLISKWKTILSEHNWFGKGYSVSDNINQKDILVNPFHECNRYSQKIFKAEYFQHIQKAVGQLPKVGNNFYYFFVINLFHLIQKRFLF